MGDHLFPWIIAHRGAMAEAPENTKSAFKRALSYPIDGIEFDVQLSRDRVPVVFHDHNLKKINGSLRSISSYNYDELCQMDWGAWFADSFSGEAILTLEEVLLGFGPRTRLLVEIKSDESPDSHSVNRYAAQMVPDMVKRSIPNVLIDKMMVLSFDADIISTAMAGTPNLKYGLNLKTEKFSVTDWPGNIYAVSLPIHKINTRFVNNCHTNGLAVMTYSCNTKKMLDKALELGIDVIMTDDPGRICVHMDRRNR